MMTAMSPLTPSLTRMSKSDRRPNMIDVIFHNVPVLLFVVFFKYLRF